MKNVKHDLSEETGSDSNSNVKWVKSIKMNQQEELYEMTNL
ncbi:hypothetical protein P4T89_12420 [Bacillus nakamurai]|nr:hypothetical protein [Bacillus nakamurai]MED1228325.1 hypothetical protein [Bacillus nakamurai]